ncbi:hypothetical protein SAMN04487930_10747 [Cytophaga hutchinsonii ATCC 33406]|nr:hypothetical protein SAMN04487930_10747 [Cytophaga hutchinsonii ATCC 33406]
METGLLVIYKKLLVTIHKIYSGSFGRKHLSSSLLLQIPAEI